MSYHATPTSSTEIFFNAHDTNITALQTDNINAMHVSPAGDAPTPSTPAVKDVSPSAIWQRTIIDDTEDAVPTVSMPQAQAVTVALEPPMTLPEKTVSPTRNVAPSGPSRPSLPEDLCDGLALQETLHNHPQSLRIILKKYANSVRVNSTFIAKDKYPLPRDV